MNLIVSSVGTDSGLMWEENLNASLYTIDAHDHTPGKGVQIPPSGLNINASLPMNNNSITGVQSAVLQPQISLATLYGIYSIGNDLYFNDGAGNIIRITSGGSVNATSSGISSGTATASFVSSVLVVNAASNKPANIQGGSLLLGNNIVSSNFLTLQPPSAMGANFSLTLPSIPASTSFAQVDTSGNITASVPVSGGITAANIAAGTITTTQISSSAAILGSQLSASAAIAGSQLGAAAGITPGQLAGPTTWFQSMGGDVSYVSGTTTVIQVTSFIPTSSTRPFWYSFSGNTVTPSNSGCIIVAAGVSCTFAVLAGLTQVSTSTIDNSSGTASVSVPINSLNTMSAGQNVGSTHTASLIIKINSGGGGVTITKSQLTIIQ